MENEILLRLVNRHGWPRCAKCGKPVDELVVETDAVRRIMTVGARCHGSIEVVEIPESVRVSGEDFSLAGEAFAERKELTVNAG